MKSKSLHHTPIRAHQSERMKQANRISAQGQEQMRTQTIIGDLTTSESKVRILNATRLLVAVLADQAVREKHQK